MKTKSVKGAVTDMRYILQGVSSLGVKFTRKMLA